MRLTLNNIDDVFAAKKCSVDTMQLRGYELVTELFCDSSGWGRNDELALTVDQLKDKLTELLTEHGNLTAKITNAGMFQVYVGLFKRNGKSKARKIANNTYEYTNGNGNRTIRLHNTDILEFTPVGVVVNSGGWQSNTTKARINEHLPQNMLLIQRNFDWYILNTVDDIKIPFTDNMLIAA